MLVAIISIIAVAFVDVLVVVFFFNIMSSSLPSQTLVQRVGECAKSIWLAARQLFEV